MCRFLTDTHVCLASAGVSHRAITPLEEYDMQTTTSTNALPTRLPFIQDFCAIYIPGDTKVPAWSPPDSYSGGHSVMDDIIEAIRHKTSPVIVDGETRWMPPTTQDIQQYMSCTWPTKYRSDVGDAKGWKNTVNQCLTHGQGWNFVTYIPQTGKNKRHCLVERAFNGVCILGSGVCKGLNDRKPKKTPYVSKPVILPEALPSVELPELFTASPLWVDDVSTPSTTSTTFADTHLTDFPMGDVQGEETFVASPLWLDEVSTPSTTSTTFSDTNLTEFPMSDIQDEESLTASPLWLDEVSTPSTTSTTFTDTNLTESPMTDVQGEEVVDYLQYLTPSELASIPEFMFDCNFMEK